MKYKNLGRSGLKVSELSFGAWLTFGDSLDLAGVKECLRIAFDAGVNFFDNAEAYGGGKAETVMGAALRDFRREDLVISTKIYWGGEGPNDVGLSWKHLVEGTKASLKRLGLEYADILFCHRPDSGTPLEETVRAMDHLIRSGCAFYWGTSEWPAERIESAMKIGESTNSIRPIAEQPQYNMLQRSRVEAEYAPLFERYGIGTTIWSPLASGVLTGKYLKGIPKGTRLAKHEWLQKELTNCVHLVVGELAAVALYLECTLAQLGIAWCLKNPNVTTVLLGASNPEQLAENLGAINVVEKLDEKVLSRIEDFLAKAVPKNHDREQ